MTKKLPPILDLNTTDEAVLVQRLKISSRLAKRIIALRPYRSVEELQRVWGIETETLKRITPLLSVAGRVQEAAPAPPPHSAPLAEPESLVEESIRLPDRIEESFLPKEAAPRPIFLPPPAPAAPASKPGQWVNFTLIMILLVGAFFRFTGLNWDQNLHQHPDERYVTMVAEQIRGVSGIAAYFDPVISTLNPLKTGSYTYGMLPLFLTRMVAEWVKMTSYDAVVLVGRAMSGLFDLAAVWMLYLVGTRLYNRRTGLLAAGLATAAVLPIQLSHYFAVDSFSTVFVVASFYFTILAVPLVPRDGVMTRRNLQYFAIFGFIVGLAGACKVNTLPVFGVILLAGAARLASGWKKPEFRSLLRLILPGWGLAILMTFLAFRIFQPYAFSGPGFFGLSLNQRWLDVLQEVTNQVAGNSDWPPNHHWTNRGIAYAWSNMVNWGLGLPLGLAGWLGWAWAAWRIWKGDWRRHFLPFAWVASYFLWQNAQFWRYMRYFLPIYPFIILFAAFFLLELYELTRESRARFLAKRTNLTPRFANLRRTWQGGAGMLAMAVVIGGSYLYAFGFTRIYTRPITRVSASQWILANIPGPLNVLVNTPQGKTAYPLLVKSRQVVTPGEAQSADLVVRRAGSVSSISAINVSQVGVSLYFRLSEDEAGEKILTEGRLTVADDSLDSGLRIPFGDITLVQDQTYYFHYRVGASSRFSLGGAALRNENQDEPSIPLDWSYQDQAPGNQEGVLSFKAGGAYRLNRLEIQQFKQAFAPNQTTLKVSLFLAGDNPNPLIESSQRLDFSKPGEVMSPVFDFAPVDLEAGRAYRVQYEVTGGGPVNLHGENFTLETGWDDALPLSVNQIDALGGIYTPLNLELYEPDTPAKRDAMLRILSESNYIVIPSNRAYDAMPRLPLRYPLTLKYYQTLFDCPCSGDVLENRAYGLKAPFKSPLGFELVATFESEPSIGPFTLNDQTADESFTVYDHPRVLIFKKSSNFSIERVAAVLNSVDLDQVIFQNPLAYTRSPNALQLPADRLEAQTVGGTWSAMFNRLDLLNTQPFLGGLAWYLLLLLMGWIVFPLVFTALRGLPDRGYPLIRMAGLILAAWMAWMLGSLKVLPFSRATILFCVFLLMAASAALLYRRRQDLVQFLRLRWKYLLWIEVLFLALFLYSLWVRLGNPDLWHPWLGGEKPMDFTFLNATLKAEYFPPENPWFAGHSLNYYYYGYVLAAIPTKLLGIVPATAYNLILPAWFAMTGIGLFSLGYNLVAGLSKRPAEKPPVLGESNPGQVLELARKWITSAGLPYLAGGIALLAVLILGNLHMLREFWTYLPDAPAEQLVSPIDRAGAVFSEGLKILIGEKQLPGENGRWYFEASRPILHDGPDTPIAEFPYFTFLYADMHPHLLTMPVYSLALGWMLSVLLFSLTRRDWLERILCLALAGLVFGCFSAAHTWDFPTFLGLGGLVVLWDVWRSRSASFRQTLVWGAAYVLAFGGLAIIFYQPFAEWFRSEYASLELWKGLRTPLSDYLAVFGLSLFVMVSLLAADLAAPARRLVRQLRSPGINAQTALTYGTLLATVIAMLVLWSGDYQVLAVGLPYLAGILYVAFFKHELSLLRRIAWLLYAAGVAVTMLVEVVVLKGDVGRSNTVFRFYNQAWLLSGLALSVGLLEMLSEIGRWTGWKRGLWLVGLCLLALGAFSYPLVATGKKIADRWPNIENPPHALDGSLFMLGEADVPDGKAPAFYNDEDRMLNLSLDRAAIQFMQDHVNGSPVIVEANTPEYRWGSRFSVYTGLPSVVGWSWHTRQHNSLLDGALIEKRIHEIADFYNTSDVGSAAQFIQRYQVRYIILGGVERAYYDPVGLAKFQQMLAQGLIEQIFGDDSPATTTIFEVISSN